MIQKYYLWCNEYGNEFGMEKVGKDGIPEDMGGEPWVLWGDVNKLLLNLEDMLYNLMDSRDAASRDLGSIHSVVDGLIDNRTEDEGV